MSTVGQARFPLKLKPRGQGTPRSRPTSECGVSKRLKAGPKMRGAAAAQKCRAGNTEAANALRQVRAPKNMSRNAGGAYFHSKKCRATATEEPPVVALRRSRCKMYAI
jgi:hypothetical protein